jgi:ABC-type sugar transport system ATPase subunit
MGTLSSLAASGRGVVVVSHALRWLHRGADRVVVFAGGGIVERVEGHQALHSDAGRRLFAAVHETTTSGFPGALPGERGR